MTTVVQRRRTRVDIYTDGACSGHPGPGGWAWSTLDGKICDSGGTASTTNQRMEMMAVLMALRDFPSGKNPVTICTDSAYVMNCFVDGWHRSWKDGKKRNGHGDDVSNWDLWKPLITLVGERDVQWRKVKGHSGDPGNDLVDKMAVLAKRVYQ